MSKSKKIAVAALIAVIVLRIQNLLFGFSTAARLLSLPPQQIPDLYSQDMLYFLLTILGIVFLLMFIFPKKTYRSRRDQEIDKINRAAYNQNQNPFI